MSKLFGVYFLLFYYRHLVIGGVITINTPKQSGSYTFTLLSTYGYSVDNSKSIKFEVKACQDAYVGLMKDDINSKVLYHVAIGGWHNAKTVIRIGKDKPQVTEYDAVLLSCSKYVAFEVSWKSGKVEVWTTISSTWTKILSYSHADTGLVKYVGVTTAIWADGYWTIFTNEETTEVTTHTTQAMTTSTKFTSRASTSQTTELSTTDETEVTTHTTPVMTTSTVPTSQASTSLTTELSTTASNTTQEANPENENMFCRIICNENYTTEELKKSIEQLRTMLQVDRKTTSKYITSRISAKDERASAAFIGYIGTTILAVTFGTLLLLDLPNLKRMFSIMGDNILSR